MSKDRTNYAFPMPAVEGQHVAEFGMTYRQWLAGNIGAQLFANDRIIIRKMQDCNGDEDQARHELARAVWKLADILLETENE